MEEMDVFLHADDPATGDIPTLSAQMTESNVCIHICLLISMMHMQELSVPMIVNLICLFMQ